MFLVIKFAKLVLSAAAAAGRRLLYSPTVGMPCSLAACCPSGVFLKKSSMCFSFRTSFALGNPYLSSIAA